MQASRRDLGASVGRMIFHGRGVERTLREVGNDKLKSALQKHGLGDVSVEKMADVLSGKDRAGWSQAKVKRAVQALQDVHVASAHQGAGQMVLTASREAQTKEPKMSAEERKLYMQKLARERRAEANAEAEGTTTGSVGVLDGMRGAMGRANKQQGPAAATAKGVPEDVGGARALREEMRQQLHLAPKMVVPKSKMDDASSSSPGFVA